ncbi:MAG: hypothetical protein O7D91_17625 [Planctomycetota bacterium]|nr:hypothetical protein [Planctomycetota bacterium]
MPDRFREFCEAVQALWPRFNTTPVELKEKAWGSLSRFTDDEIADALKRHAKELPDNVRPNWGMIFRSVAAGSGSGRNELEILISQYRARSSDRHGNWHGDWCMGKSDHEVWQCHVQAQVRSILFIFGKPRATQEDRERAIESAKYHIETTTGIMKQTLIEEGATPPPWLDDVGIPERWLQAAGASARSA